MTMIEIFFIASLGILIESVSDFVYTGKTWKGITVVAGIVFGFMAMIGSLWHSMMEQH